MFLWESGKESRSPGRNEFILAGDDLLDLKKAKYLLESSRFSIKIINRFGRSVERILTASLPDSVEKSIARISRKSLEKVLEIALFTIRNDIEAPSKDVFHRAAVTATGTVGGFFGLAGLAIELPISTTIIFRSIADIARSEGELLSEPETKIACLEVFALGGQSGTDGQADSAYLAVRGAMAKYVSESTEYIARAGVQKSGPALVRLIGQLSSRFGVIVSEKTAAQAIPMIGAVGGGLVNALFIDHFQNMARGHFIVRRLERKYSPEFIRDQYEKR